MKIQTDKSTIQADTRRPLIQVENSGKVIPSQAGSFFSSHSGFRLTAPNRSINITFFWPHSETSCIFSLFLLLFLLYSAAVQTCLQFVWRPVCILSVLLSSSVCNHWLAIVCICQVWIWCLKVDFDCLGPKLVFSLIKRWFSLKTVALLMNAFHCLRSYFVPTYEWVPSSTSSTNKAHGWWRSHLRWQNTHMWGNIYENI